MERGELKRCTLLLKIPGGSLINVKDTSREGHTKHVRVEP